MLVVAASHRVFQTPKGLATCVFLCSLSSSADRHHPLPAISLYPHGSSARNAQEGLGRPFRTHFCDLFGSAVMANLNNPCLTFM